MGKGIIRILILKSFAGLHPTKLLQLLAARFFQDKYV
jgi:hypothetical protein